MAIAAVLVRFITAVLLIHITDFGVGQVDVLVHSTDTGTVTESLLGWFRSADVTIQRDYVSQGDKNYTLVKNFNNNDKEELFLAGKPED